MPTIQVHLRGFSLSRVPRTLLLLLWVGATLFSEPEVLLRASIIGSVSMAKSPNYFRTMSGLPVQKFLLLVAKGPLSEAAATTALADAPGTLKDLLALGLIRKEEGRYHLNFALFTVSDQKRIREATRPHAESLAKALEARKKDLLSALAAYDVPDVDRRDLAFIVLGCMSLDWDGLAFTSEQGYRAATSRRPDGNYVPHAEESNPLSLRGLYWGSRTSEESGLWLTTFGDDACRRLTPPSEFVAPMLRILMALREAPMSLDELGRSKGLDRPEVAGLMPILQAYGWVREDAGRFRIRVPVLSRRDEPMVKKVRAIGRQVMAGWLQQHYSLLQAELGDLSYSRSGVRFQEGFTMIWHYLFGMANERLVAAGFFADPYDTDRAFKGALPVVYDWDIQH